MAIQPWSSVTNGEVSWCLKLEVYGFGLRVQGLGFRVFSGSCGLGSSQSSLESRVSTIEFRSKVHCLRSQGALR